MISEDAQYFQFDISAWVKDGAGPGKAGGAAGYSTQADIAKMVQVYLSSAFAEIGLPEARTREIRLSLSVFPATREAHDEWYKKQCVLRESGGGTDGSIDDDV